MENVRLILGINDTSIDKWGIDRINRKTHNFGERLYELDQFNVGFMHYDDRTYRDASVDQFIRYMSGVDTPFIVADTVYNTNKKFRHIKFVTHLIELMDDKVIITKYRFLRNARIVERVDLYSLNQFYEGFVYIIKFNGELHVFSTRESAIQYGMSTNQDIFSVYSFRTIHRGSPKTCGYHHEFKDEIRMRLQNADLTDVYKILMEYVGAEFCNYTKDGEYIYGEWTNDTAKSYKLFEDENFVKRILQHPYPVNADA